MVVPAPTSAPPPSSAVAEILPPTQQAAPQVAAYNANQCPMVAASCAGCVQFQCQQQQPPSHEAMEMTAILHSQPPLQLVSCHGPIMHPSTPSNQRYYVLYQIDVHTSMNYRANFEKKKTLTKDL